ncbi:hypothetical protein DPF09_22440 [Salmonella enterica subsp. enterica serovar Agona]|nr:hypothetical protein [Salmonella enterica subsp. enterica serovar Agona]
MNNMNEYFNVKTVQVTQSLSDLGLKLGSDGKLVRLDGSRIKSNAAFKEWLYKLKAGERLPRGRYFKNKRPGKPLMILDEFHSMFADI